MEIQFKQNPPKDGALIAFIYAGEKLPSVLEDSALISEKVLKNKGFSGKRGETLLLTPAKADGFTTILLVGLGDKAKVTPLVIQKAAGNAVGALAKTLEPKAALLLPSSDKESEYAANAAFGAILASYRFGKYQTKKSEDKEKSLTKLAIIVENTEEAEKAFKPWDNLAKGIYTARDLISEPANVVYPETFVKKAEKIAPEGLEITVLNKSAMAKAGMNMLLGVAQGSEKEPKLLICKWLGNPKKKNVSLGIIGKGVCFDSGGISLKPSQGMDKMKYDMAGAGAALGLMQALALNKAKVNVVAVMPLVENMPSGSAQRPGDVVVSMSGKTVEILNTDAEGRLILGDAITYIQKEFKPETIIDMATLTGAIKIALGTEYAGLFSNDEELIQKLIKSGRKSGEKVWALPMDTEYAELLKSDIADIKNISDGGPGSITAAKFLEAFVEEKTKWAHLDIAAMAWEDKGKPTNPKGAAGFGVKLLNQFIFDNYL